MANTVQIVITVDNAQAQQAVTQTITSFERMPESIRENTAALQALTAKLNETADAMTRMGNATRKMGGHVTTSLDGVRLLSQELGLRLPRALESMLSRMPAVTTAISTMMGAFAGIAIAEVFYRAGEAVYNLYTKYISLNAVAEEYNKTVTAHRDEGFVDTHSIETTTQRIDEATEAAKRFNAQAAMLHEEGRKDLLSGFDPYHLASGITSMVEGHGAAEQGRKSQEQADSLKVKQIEQQHELNRLQIEAEHATDGSLRGQAKLTAEMQKQIELHREDQNYSRQKDSALQPFGLKSGGQQQRDLEDQITMRKLQADKDNLASETRDRTIQMQNEATNAALAGVALLRKQELEAEGEVYRSATGNQAQINAIRAKFHNEEMKRIQEETDAVNKRADAERDASLTGLAKIQAQGQSRIKDINQREQGGLYTDQSGLNTHSDLAAKERATATAQMYREMGDAEKEYREKSQAENDRMTSEQLTGFAKIDKEVADSTQKRADEFEKMYGQMAHDSAQYLSAQKQLEDDESVISTSGDRQRAEIVQQIQQQTLQMTTEAAQAERRVRATGIGGWVDDYHRGIAEVQAAEEAMLHKIADEQAKTGSDPKTDAMFNQQRVDAVQKADAQIEQLNTQMAHQVASTLQGAFADPVHFIQNKMKQMMFEILADWIMQSKLFSSTFGKMIPGGGHTARPGAGGVMGTGITSSTIGAGSPSVTSSGNGTVDQAMVAPGYSGTVGSGGVGAGGTFGGMLSSAGTIAGLGMSTAAGLSSRGSSAPADSTTGSWNDPTDPEAQASAASAAQVQQMQSQTSSASAIGGVVAAGVGAYTGTKGIIGAFEGGHASDILSGAWSGAAMGASIGMLAGPAGALIGGAAGAIGGATAGLVGWASGEGDRISAQKYYRDSIKPAMEQAETSYGTGDGGDALSALSAINSAASAGYTYIATKFGASAAQWAKAAYIDKEQTYLGGMIERMASGGRDYGSKSMAQFHTGGTIAGFGDFATSGNEGLIHAMLGETVMRPQATAAHGPALGLMNAGASPADVASHYLKTTGSMNPGGNVTHNHNYEGHTINALDGADFENYLKNRGGMQAFQRANNKYSSQYGGDGVNG